jgi:very-short-patch-repair endonuclease
MRTDIDAAMAKLAARQHGVFTVAQCQAEAGYTKLAWRRVSSGRWIHVTGAALAFANSTLNWESKAHAATLSTPRSVVSGRAAARLFDIGPFARVPVEVLAPFPANARGSGYTVHRCRHFSAITTTEVDAIPVLSPAETIADLARTESRLLVQRVAEEAIVARLVTVEKLGEVANRRLGDGCPGGVRLHAVVDDIAGDAVPESELERRLLRLLDEQAALPRVVRQMPVPWWELAAGRVDAAIPEWKLIIECDGRRWHSKETDFERDRFRDNQATVHGWRVLRFSYRALAGDPASCVEAIIAAGLVAA